MFDNFGKFLGSFTTENNQHHSKSAVENESHDEDREDVWDMICKFFQQQGVPEVEVDKFIGNPLEYRYFSTKLKEVVERKIKDPVGRSTRPVKLTDGEAKDLLKHCIHLTRDIDNNNAIMLPSKRYGNPHLLLASYRKEIKSLALVKPGDVNGFQKFS